jgi:hypothetical protein
MKEITEELYKKLANITDKVRREFYDRGVVAPVKTRSGIVRIGPYDIKRTGNHYAIVDLNGVVEVEGINLPQTAALVANNMALGRYRGIDLIRNDREYGWAEFEEELHEHAVKNSKNKDIDYLILHQNMAEKCREKKEYYKNMIDSRYTKLLKLV